MFSSAPDYYKILQVRPTASPEVIEAVYRQLARLYHPDRNIKNDTTPKMQAINVAYSVLSNPNKRLEYDLYLAGNISSLRLNMSLVRWAIARWTMMRWDGRLTTVCVILSILCLVGIASNLANRQIMTSIHSSVNATVVAVQMEVAIVETVTAITADPSMGPLSGAVLPASGLPASELLAGVNHEGAGLHTDSGAISDSGNVIPTATAVPQPGEAPLITMSSQLAGLDSPGHADSKSDFTKRPPEPAFNNGPVDHPLLPLTVVPADETIPINMIRDTYDLLLDELTEFDDSTWGIVQIQSSPYYRQLDILQSNQSAHSLSAGAIPTN